MSLSITLYSEIFDLNSGEIITPEAIDSAQTNGLGRLTCHISGRQAYYGSRKTVNLSFNSEELKILMDNIFAATGQKESMLDRVRVYSNDPFYNMTKLYPGTVSKKVCIELYEDFRDNMEKAYIAFGSDLGKKSLLKSVLNAVVGKSKKEKSVLFSQYVDLMNIFKEGVSNGVIIIK